MINKGSRRASQPGVKWCARASMQCFNAENLGSPKSMLSKQIYLVLPICFLIFLPKLPKLPDPAKIKNTFIVF